MHRAGIEEKCSSGGGSTEKAQRTRVRGVMQLLITAPPFLQPSSCGVATLTHVYRLL